MTEYRTLSGRFERIERSRSFSLSLSLNAMGETEESLTGNLRILKSFWSQKMRQRENTESV